MREGGVVLVALLFADSGLLLPSVIRLAFLQTVPLGKIMGRIGSIAPDRHHRLLTSLSRHLAPG